MLPNHANQYIKQTNKQKNVKEKNQIYNNHFSFTLLDGDDIFCEKLHSFQRYPVTHFSVNQLQPYTGSLGRDLVL